MAHLTWVVIPLNLSESGGRRCRLLRGSCEILPSSLNLVMQRRNQSLRMVKALKAGCPEFEPFSHIFHCQKRLLWLKKCWGSSLSSWAGGWKCWRAVWCMGVTAASTEVWAEAFGFTNAMSRHGWRCSLFNCLSVPCLFLVESDLPLLWAKKSANVQNEMEPISVTIMSYIHKSTVVVLKGKVR